MRVVNGDVYEDKHNDTSRGLSPHERLAVAIVQQAVQDYYDTEREMNYCKRGGAPWERERCKLYLLEQWFLGDWCGALTYGNGEVLLRYIKRGEIDCARK